MRKPRYLEYLLSCSIISLIALVPPVFAEVLELYTDKNYYQIDEFITFQGRVNHGDSGLVTIVIRDNNDQFVLLTQAITESDYSFKKTIEIGNKFTNIGNYNATGFILNMTSGITAEFEIKENETKPNYQNSVVTEDENEMVADNESEYKKMDETPSEKLLDFVDPQKDPIYYVERYYNEPEYKSWFDKNYPEYTIEEAVGYDDELIDQKDQESISNKEIIPNAEAISIPKNTEIESNDNELSQFLLVIAGLAILFGATYGVKRKVDHNSKQISINRSKLKQKILNPIIRSDPLDILKLRLAKGELSLNEYNQIKRKLQN